MDAVIVISGLISLVILIWAIATLGNILAELRIQTKQQALMLAIKKAQGGLNFNENLLLEYERFYAMKKSSMFD